MCPSLVLALLLLRNPLFNVWQYATGSPGIDYFILWSVPHALKTHALANIYAPDSQRDMASVLISESSSPQVSEAQRGATAINMRLYHNRVAVTGSPLVYALVGLTATGAYDKDLSRFTVASWLCFLGATLHLLSLRAGWRSRLLVSSRIDDNIFTTIQERCSATQHPQ